MKNRYTGLLGDVAICLTTFEREDLCRRLVESILRYYPDASIFVANDGHESLKIDKATVYNLEFNRGVSYKRNFLAQTIPKRFKYILYVDDDMLFSECTRIEELKMALDSTPGLSLVSGEVYDFGEVLRPYEAVFSWEDDDKTLRLVPVDGDSECDLTQNFFLIRRDVLNKTSWREELKLAEHVPFFVDLKAHGGKCAHTKAVSIDHYPEVKGEYASYRTRHAQYQIVWMDDVGLTKVIRPNGAEILRSKLDDPDYWPWVPSSRGDNEVVVVKSSSGNE